MEMNSAPSGATTTSVGANPSVPVGSRKTSALVEYEEPLGVSGRNQTRPNVQSSAKRPL